MQVDSSQGIDAVSRGLAKMLHSGILMRSENQVNSGNKYEVDYDCGILEMFNLYTIEGVEGYSFVFRISGSDRSIVIHSEDKNSSFTVEQLDDNATSQRFI